MCLLLIILYAREIFSSFPLYRFELPSVCVCVYFSSSFMRERSSLLYFLPLPSSIGVLTRVSVAICHMRALEFSEHGVVGFVAEIFQCLWWMYVYAGFLLVVLLALVLLTAAFGQTLSAR